jgi:hypothetical protein
VSAAAHPKAATAVAQRTAPRRRAGARGNVAQIVADGSPSTVDVDTDVLADWIAQQGDDRWWRVDGDRELVRRESRPVSAVAFVDRLRRHGGRLSITVGTRGPQTAPGTAEQLDAVIGWKNFARSIECRWRRSNGRLGLPWEILEELTLDDELDGDLFDDAYDFGQRPIDGDDGCGLWASREGGDDDNGGDDDDDEARE